MPESSDRSRESPEARIYRRLSWILPRELREHFGEDMVELFEDRLREAEPGGRLRISGRALIDLIRQGLAERLRETLASGASRTGGSMIDKLRLDLRYSLRTLRKRPGFTLVAASTLAIGIGANTAIFSVLNGVLLMPLRFGEPSRLVAIWETSEREGVPKDEASVALFHDWRERNQTLTDLTAWTYDTVVLEEEDVSVALDAVLVYPNFLAVLELDPLFGRGFLDEDAPPGLRGQVVLLSHALWRERFDADPGVVGRTLRLDGDLVTVVGVMPGDVAAPDENADLWQPVGFRSTSRWERHGRRYNVYGRLKENVTVEEAQQDFSRIAAQLSESEFSDIYEGWDALVVPLHEEIVGDVRSRILVAFAAVGVILLIACVNLAAMLLARSAERRHELAVRDALGAGRRRLVEQLLTESVLLALAGGAIGLVVAVVLHRALLVLEPGILPRSEELAIDGRAFLFTFVVSVIAGVVFGLAPALRASGWVPSGGLGAGGGRNPLAGGGVARGAMVAGQLALATVLLCGAGLLLRTTQALLSVNPGFEVDSRVALRVFLDGRRYDDDAKERDYFRRLNARVGAVPGVRSVGASSALPMDPLGIAYDLPFRFESQKDLDYEDYNELPQADFRVVTPGYFETMGVPLLTGRLFDDFDREDTTFVALVNETMARQFWPAGSPVGQRVETPSTDWHWFEIVGVVGDTRYYGLRSEPRPEIYVAHAQVPRGIMTFVARAEGDPAALVEPLRQAVLELDRAQPVHSLVPLADLVEGNVAAERFYASVLTAFAAMALTLACTGVFGVATYVVSARRREFGLRLALGARRSTIFSDVLGRAVGLGLLGAGAGLLIALGATRAVSSVLFHVSATDAITYAVVGLLLLATSSLASLLPAFRASRVDPVVALRQE